MYSKLEMFRYKIHSNRLQVVLTAHFNVVEGDPLEVRHGAKRERRESSDSMELSRPALLVVGETSIEENSNLQVTVAYS